jgi:hypothetical protein
MPLPNLEKIVPSFELTIPSTGESMKFRPFLVKEEKILLIAMESNEDKVILDAIVDVVKACALSPLKTDDLANFDLEYLFLQLRSRSVSEVVDLSYRCKNDIVLTAEEVQKRGKNVVMTEGSVPMGPCGHIVKITLKLDEVNVQTNPEHSKTIMLTETMGINMRYPNYKMAKQMMLKKKSDSAIGDILQSIAYCVESVFDETSVYSNFQQPEILEWIDRLTQKQFTKLSQFFETIPKLAHTVPFYCTKCGYKEDIYLEGLQSFFA